MAKGRPFGSGAQDLPTCERHPTGRVVKNGTYGRGTERRQMFRCYPRRAKAHDFVGPVARIVATGHACELCENTVARHQGPRVAPRYDFPVAQAAAALVMVGQGVSYTETADRIRVRNRRQRFEAGAQLVANWTEVLSPVVAAQFAETEWPETVVLDATWFMVTNRRTGDTTQAFCVLAVHGYPAGAEPGRCWALRATLTRSEAAWTELLTSLPGQPTMVVCDEDDSIIRAVEAVWPGTFIKRCEHHLREGVKKRMATYGKTTFGHPAMKLLNDAFHSPAGWRAFKKGVGGVGVEAWVEAYDEVVTEQVKRRAELPAHHSTGAIDEHLAKVREFMEPRAFCYRNAERTNRLLELVRLRLNRCDDPVVYARAIRSHLAANNGRLPRQGAIRDAKGVPSLRVLLPT